MAEEIKWYGMLFRLDPEKVRRALVGKDYCKFKDTCPIYGSEEWRMCNNGCKTEVMGIIYNCKLIDKDGNWNSRGICKDERTNL